MSTASKLRSWILDYAYAGFRQVGAFRDPTQSASLLTGERPPVLILPGIFETWQFMGPLIRHLHDRGHPVHVVSTLGRNRGTVGDAVRIVADYLDLQNLRGVTIVAHSKGGLIGKLLMMSDRRRVSRMVAINCPFSGSSLARFTVIPSLRAFSPRDVTIRLLVEEDSVNERITSIFASFDPHIPSGSYLAGATNIRLPLEGHFRPLGDPRLLAAVAEACAD